MGKGSGDDRSSEALRATTPIALADTAATPENRAPEDRVTSPTQGDDATPSRTLQPDDFVAGRYRVIRFIARGGMGEVYEVEDVELRSRIALKTIRPELADDSLSLERFRREIQLARQVTHPNVCRIFDLGHHLTATARGRVTFLTMELLDGQSLLRRVREKGPLSTVDALPIVEQMAAALGEAHALGIVHRDFKSDNVMLCAQPSGGLRAVVTDFGLARTAAGTGFDARATRSGQMVGTPTYMAPEQLEGGAVKPKADLYALGIVMYEMVTGKVPFTGENAFSVAVKRLHRAPDPPRTHVPGLDKRWEQVILRCLERDPERRFASASEVVAALKDRTQRVTLPTPASKRAWLVGGLLLALAGTTVAFVARSPRAGSQAASKVATHRSVAVLGLRNLSQRPEAAWLSTALGELLSGELGADERLRRVPAESITRVKRDLQLADGESLSPETLTKVRATLDVDYVIAGSYLAVPGPTGAPTALRLDVALQDAHSGETLASVSQTGKENELFDLVSRAGRELRSRIGGADLSPSQEATARSSLPSNPEAARAYAEGLAKLRLSDAQGARELLEKAAALEPEFPLIHAALAQTWEQLGHVTDEQSEAKRAFDGASQLPRPDQLLVEARYRVTMREWPRAIELYRALFDFYPDSVEYGLELARVQVKATQGKQALETLAQVVRQARSAADDPRLDLVRMQADDLLGDYREGEQAGARAAEKARALGARQLVAEALTGQAYAVSFTGDRARARQLADEGAKLYEAIGDPKGLGEARMRRGGLDWSAGDLPAALSRFGEALAIFRKLGADGKVAGALMNHAGVQSDLGHHDAAIPEYEAALALSRKTGDKKTQSGAMSGLAQQLNHLGRYEEAEQRMREVLDLVRALGKKNYEGIALEVLGNIRFNRGDARGCVELEAQAIEVYQAIADLTGVGNARNKQATGLLWSGDEARAAQALADAGAMLEKLGEKTRVASVKSDLAELELARGRLAEAEAAARAAVAGYSQAQAASHRASAAAILARVLVAAGRVAEARAAVEGATVDRQLRVQSTLAAVELADGKPADAVARLEPTLANPASVAAPLPEVIEAQLVLGRAEIAAHVRGPKRGQARVQAALADARTHRLGLLAKPQRWLK
jgi:serine/threonine protein kinase/tetratricopeptide (TPR) repeat protein